MMKWTFLILLVAVAQASVLREATRNIPAPKLVSLISLYPPGFTVQWEPVTSDDPSEPIIGYKVVVWELQLKKTHTYKMVNGVFEMVEEFVREKVQNDLPPDHEPMMQLPLPDFATTLSYGGIDIGVLYEIRVRAFTAKGDGPYSKPMTLMLTE